MIKLLSNGGDINVPDEYTVCLFLRKLKCPELNSLFSEVLVTLLEEKVLISDLLPHPYGQFRFVDSQIAKPFKYLTKIITKFLEPLVFKCSRLLFKGFLGLIVVLLIKGMWLLSHKSSKPIQDGLFRGCSRMGRTKGPTVHKFCHTYPTMIKLGTVIPSLNRIQKYVNCVTGLLSSADISIFSSETGKSSYIKKYRYILHFDS